MPKWPVPQEHRIVPRGIDGTTVYQTPTENRGPNLTEYLSVGILLVGLALGVVYLEQWGSLQSSKDREQSKLANHNR